MSRRAHAVTRAGIVAWMAALAACGTSQLRWHARLAQPDVQRLVGMWNLSLRMDVADSSRPASTSGQIALTLNQQHLPAGGLGTDPMFFGTYDVDFSRLPLAPGAVSGVPSVIAAVMGDTVRLEFAPASALPLEMRGVVRGDSVVGRWTAHERSGPGATGAFTLRRP